MYLSVNGHNSYCYTGGKLLDVTKPSIVFIHGVLNDHSVWALQSRWFANHGYNVLALDLPGHCKSAGDPPQSVAEAADFVVALLDAAGIERAALVGHSWGSLIALEAAATLQARVSHLVLIGTAYPMVVSESLLEAAQYAPEKGIALINLFSRSTLAAPPSALGPGTWVHGSSTALNRRVQAGHTDVNLFHRGFVACNNYRGAEHALSRLECPMLVVLGTLDAMTTPRAAEALIEHARKLGKPHKVVRLHVGHHQMTEAPEATLAALRDFVRT